jgi:hypothetical protein
MYIPGQALPAEIKELVLMALNDSEVKAELSKQIRTEMDTRQTNYSGHRPTYESLTSGDVNMQLRMAASGYDVYGRTMLSSNSSFTNKNAYKKMKNQIKYGASPQNQFRNRGSKNIE